MKVLLIQDVYKLGRAGEVKKVAAGYGRNYLIPQGLAVLATPGAVKQAERIRQQAAQRRVVENKEMSGIAELLKDLVLTFPAKAGETGKLYGSVTSQMIVDQIQEKLDVELNRRQVDAEPIRELGQHQIDIRLTMDLVPEVTVIVHREGERPVMPGEEVEEEEAAEAEAEVEAEAEAGAEAGAEAEAPAEAEAEAEVETEAEGETAAEAEEETA